MRARSPVLTALLVLAVGLTLAACGGRTEQPDRPTTPATHSPLLHRFFTGLATGRPADLRRAQALTAPGSPARTYATFQLDLAAARRDDGVRMRAARVVTTSRGYDLCGPQPGRARCGQFARLDLRDGRIWGFDVDGDDVADNLSAGSGEPQQLEHGGSVEFLSSYRQPSTGASWVLVRVRATSQPVQLQLGRARYARVGGEVLAPETRSHREFLRPGQQLTAALVFPDAEVGGTLRLHLIVGGQPEDVSLGTGPFVPETDATDG